jgi:hypothetical protein
MGRIVCFYKDKFFEFTTVAEGPCTDLMDEKTFIEFSTRMYGEMYAESPHQDGLKARMDRARARGHSSMIDTDDNVEDFLKNNMLNSYGSYDDDLEQETGDGYVSKWPGMDALVLEYWGENALDGSPDVVMPGDTKAGGQHG